MKQAVLAREEQEKRMRLEGQRQKDELSKKEKAHQRKAKEFEQKTKKQKVGGINGLHVFFEHVFLH